MKQDSPSPPPNGSTIEGKDFSSSLPPPKPSKSKPEFFTNDQLIAIMSSCKTDYFCGKSELHTMAERELLRRLKLTTPNENH